jgi:hypothetical protein
MRRLNEYGAGQGRKRVAQNILRLGANVADTETITIGRDVFEMDTNATSTAGNIAVNVTGNLTPTLAGPIIVAAINAYNTGKLFAVQIAVGVIVVYGNEPLGGLGPVPCTETLAGAGNAWDAAAMVGGNPGVSVGTVVVSRAAVATEVTEGAMYFVLPFTVVAAYAVLRTTAGVFKAWDGVTGISGQRVKVDNTGAADFIAGDVMTVIASS